MTRSLLAAPARRLRRAPSSWLPCACLLVAAWTSALRAQDATPSVEPPPTPTLSLSEVMERSEDAHVRLHTIEKKIPPQDLLPQMQTELLRVAAQVEAAAGDTSRRLKDNPPLSVVPDIELPWQQLRSELTQRKEQMARLGKQLDDLGAEITQLAGDAAQARAALAAAHAPPEVIEPDDQLLRSITTLRQDLLARQRKLLLLRNRATESLAQIDEAKADIDSFSRARVQQLFERESVALWRQPVLQEWTAAGVQARQAVLDFSQPLVPYLRRSAGRAAAHLLLFVFIALLLRRGHVVAAAWPQRDARLEELVALTAYPWSAALLVSLLFMLPIELDVPRTLWVIVAALAIPAVLRVWGCIIAPPLAFLAYPLTIYAAVALLRSMVASSGPLLQACVAAETLLAGGLTWWVIRRRANRFGPGTQRLLRTVGPAAVGVLAASCLGAVCGFVDLAQLVVFATWGGVCAGAIMFIGRRIVLGLSAYLLRVWPLTDLRLVRRNRERLLRFIARTLTVLLAALWAVVVLRNLRLLDPVLGALRAVLDVHLQRGAISLSLEDVVEFGLTIWLSRLISAFLRFVLEEDIYPRVTLPRGVPYALSTLLHYLILVFGFFVGLGVVGVDLTKVTILAGALGVGVGFGLQNIVNNFVSGLILLFERPVQVGDSVMIRNVSGEVQHIGIRSSVVRTGDGAEVILPNALLISDPVTNWTFSNRLRRITVKVGVAYGSDPATVTALLRGLAAAHPEVLDSPEPAAVFTGSADGGLNFQLQVWTDRSDSWGVVQSDLYLAVHRALRDAGIPLATPPSAQSPPDVAARSGAT